MRRVVIPMALMSVCAAVIVVGGRTAPTNPATKPADEIDRKLRSAAPQPVDKWSKYPVRPPDVTVVWAEFPGPAEAKDKSREKLLMDIYRPKNAAGPRVAVLFIHGGGWRNGSRKDWGWWAQELADRGYVGFCVDYRMASPRPVYVYHPYPIPVDDCQQAVRWIRANAEKYGVDP